MNGNKLWIIAVAALIVSAGCDEGIDDFNSSAKLSGFILNSVNDPTGVNGVQVVAEADPNATNPYPGPDRWFSTNSEGYFEGAVFLGREDNNVDYLYIGDLNVQYFYEGMVFNWHGGVTVSPGSHFTFPTVYLTQFIAIDPNGGQ